MFCLIGNCPSSGSTLLADLLDSTLFTACGPELEIFCNNKFYNFPEYKKNIFKTGEVANIRTTGIYPRWNRLNVFGYSLEQFKKDIESSNNIASFFDQFTKTFLHFRKKNENGIVFEKTPQNIHCISDFLKSYTQGYFIVVVRNPISVYTSLRNRNYGNYASLVTWLINGAETIPFVNHPRVKIIRYEDLVNNPFQITADLLQTLKPGMNISADDVKRGYENNPYRFENEKGIGSWSAKREGKIVIANFSQELDPKIRAEFYKLMNLKISKSYSRLFNLPQVSFKELIDIFGYSDEIRERLKNISAQSTGSLKFSLNDYQKIFVKWFRAARRGNVGLKDLRSYFSVVEKVG